MYIPEYFTLGLNYMFERYFLFFLTWTIICHWLLIKVRKVAIKLKEGHNVIHMSNSCDSNVLKSYNLSDKKAKLFIENLLP